MEETRDTVGYICNHGCCFEFKKKHGRRFDVTLANGEDYLH